MTSNLLLFNVDLAGFFCLFVFILPADRDHAPSYKTFFMLNSPEHKILNAHKYINNFSLFQAQVSPEC